MTHNLHRAGTPTNLADDYTMLCMPAKGINVEGSGPKMRRFLEIALSNDATNIGDIKTGSLFQTSADNILDNVTDGTIVHAVFPDREHALKALEQLGSENMGLSVVVQGLCQEVRQLATEAGLASHTMNHSLGRWGKKELLPEREVLEVTTMCGHAMVSASLVTHVAGRIARGRMSAERAAATLSAQCVCGIFNPVRAQKLLEGMAEAVKTANSVG